MKSIEHGYIRIIKVSVFQAMGSSTVVNTDSPWVEGSSPGRGSFLLLNLFALIQFWHHDARMIYFRETSIGQFK